MKSHPPLWSLIGRRRAAFTRFTLIAENRTGSQLAAPAHRESSTVLYPRARQDRHGEKGCYSSGIPSQQVIKLARTF